MPALNFSVFVDKVESGEKRQTIRKRRKRPIKMGNTLHLYTGMRTKGCRLLGLKTCTETFHVRRTGPYTWHRGSAELSVEELTDLVKRDGFETIEDFDAFFKGYPLGKPLDVIRW